MAVSSSALPRDGAGAATNVSGSRSSVAVTHHPLRFTKRREAPIRDGSVMYRFGAFTSLEVLSGIAVRRRDG